MNVTIPRSLPEPQPTRMPRAIEVSFPIVEINKLVKPERSNFKPIYQIHKWFARRASCVFRAILLGAIKPATQPDGTPTDLLKELAADHGADSDTLGKHVLDPFMGGGTTVVEALRIGCRVTGIDLNPVAWFIVRNQVERVELTALREAYERLAARPVAWNNNRPLRDTLLDLYQAEVLSGLKAEIIYALHVKHAVCTDPNCKREVPLFKDWFVARRTVSVRHHSVPMCPSCRKPFSWEMENASLIAAPELMIVSPLDRAGAWSYAPASAEAATPVVCPHCKQSVQLDRPSKKRPERKRVELTVLLCPECENVWQIRGPVPAGPIPCPACKHSYDPAIGNVPKNGTFQCRCGNRDKVIHSIRQLPRHQRLPVRPYAMQVYLPKSRVALTPKPQADMFEGDSANSTPAGSAAFSRLTSVHNVPKSGKFFVRITTSDLARLGQIEKQWEQQKDRLPYPKSAIPVGYNTNQMLKHNYRHWHEMFAPRQLLALSTLLDGIMAEPRTQLQEALLCAFSNTLEGNNLFVRNIPSRTTPGGTAPAGIFARHDYQPKATICEQNVWGTVSGNNTFVSRMEMLQEGLAFARCWPEAEDGKPLDPLRAPADVTLLVDNSVHALGGDDIQADIVITDPPYVGNVNYSELADFFYVWLRLALRARHAAFLPEFTPKGEEIVENNARGKSRADFYTGLGEVFRKIRDKLPDDGVLVFTFHHTDRRGDVWEGLLQALCDCGFEIAAVYPVHAEREQSLHLLDKENISYDLIHVCRRRQSDPKPRSWAGIRREVRTRARAELEAIEAGRYGGQPLGESDVRLICIGKCLELYSAHYDKVLDHAGNTLRLPLALQDIATIVDQLVTRERALPPELEDIDSLSYAWLRVLASRHSEISVDRLFKALRATRINADDLKQAGLLTRGRANRGRAFEVKQPRARLPEILERLGKVPNVARQGKLFEQRSNDWSELHFVDVLHALIGLAQSGESVLPIVERFDNQRATIIAALRYVRIERADWHEPIDSILAVMEGAPLLRQHHSGGLL